MPELDLNRITIDFARGLKIADSTMPQTEVRTTVYKPEIGPHTEAQTGAQVTDVLENAGPEPYEYWSRSGLYPDKFRQKCALCLGREPFWDWAVEIKLIRFLGDNGRLNDNMVKHLLSPYPKHNITLTDCEKLRDSGSLERKAILIL